MDSMKDSFIRFAKLIAAKTWGLIPVLLAVWWILFGIYWDMSFWFQPLSAVMFCLDVFGFCILIKYKDLLNDIHLKRAVTLVCDALLCTVIIYVGLYFEYELVSGIIFLFIFPPMLLFFNTKMFIKNSANRKIFWALILTDPLLHYIVAFLCFMITWCII